jgi:hypothetical protein
MPVEPVRAISILKMVTALLIALLYTMPIQQLVYVGYRSFVDHFLE